MSQKRSIFVEVSDTGPKPAAVPGAAQAAKRRARRQISVWLMLIFVMLVAMIAVGGLTRLTDSGLSITQWKPLTGALPPLSQADWEAEFALYQQIPQFELINKSMTVDEFKSIYWWEWSHRQLGRAIGLVWALGFFWFLLRRKIPTGWTPRLLGVGLLGGLQGAIGWWMVSSGLTGEMVSVASYRLATHLGLAFLILGLIAWFVFQLRRDEATLLQARRQAQAGLKGLTGVLVALAFAQILLGALVAGIDAGRGYIDWPMMNGEFLPSESFDYQPLWTNFFENPALVQFNHRMLGYVVFVFGLFLWARARRAALSGVRRAYSAMAAMLVLQVVIGIATVMHAAPVGLALLHQVGAVVLFCLILRARFEAAYPAEERIRGRA
ncbi:heme A synthase [Oceanicella sp. SM1341]|uniref:heme A synthase n=1 Tax=Oceanicella sp. SM1341 TaxID=1548889 RepID=UPI000E4B32DC|nr:heme A synthase [Oceanicella sp. SM1341]